MITPIELQSKTFKNGIGYDKKDVDNFINEVLIGYETLYKEKMELSDKINTLNEGLNYYKTIEKTLQKALVLAEQTAEETKETARKQAKAIEAEARGKAQLILADASNDFNHLQQQTIQLIRQYEAYKAQFKHLAAAQCELLESDSFQIHIANLNTFIDSEQSANVEKGNENSTLVRENGYSKLANNSDKENSYSNLVNNSQKGNRYTDSENSTKDNPAGSNKASEIRSKKYSAKPNIPRPNQTDYYNNSDLDKREEEDEFEFYNLIEDEQE
ncbi:DivIVA domain-containing protein [Anaerocolumna sp. AGMB13025]|uniref:DivIVA domain-containing protein n=1 Tax=Anaerocolumna sp. AGMB13025 TaxID=3039116 RepID=UPI00241F9C71|nr:DivIVA domain-containing protein [Anaerocolumna sp. AGMB13025]WFR54743.1 DivIVA domain-containing protein [Anaerocolumna sp. AGMB13025]